MTNIHPLVGKTYENAPVVEHKNIFSFGDVCLTPTNEVKSIVSMYQYSTVIAHNVLSVITKPATCRSLFQKIPPIIHTIQMIPIGKTGIMSFNNMCKEETTAPSEKNKIRDVSMNSLRNVPKAQQAQMKQGGQMGTIFGVANNGCCCCLPIAYGKHKTFVNQKLESAKKGYSEIYK